MKHFSRPENAGALEYLQLFDARNMTEAERMAGSREPYRKLLRE